MSPQQADPLNVPANMNAALDLLYFFSSVKPTQGKSFLNVEVSQLKICKLCSYISILWYLFHFLMVSSEKYGTDKSTLPNDIANFIYGPKTRNSNLQRLLYNIYSEEYDKAIV